MATQLAQPAECATPSLILFFDTEMTGLPLFTEPSDDPRQPHIVQLAAELCTPAGKVVETYQAIVNIGEPIPEEMTAIHGITNERMEAEGVHPKRMLADFFSMVDRAGEVVGHNVGFDLRMIRIQSARHLGEKWECPKPTFCTCTEAKDIVQSPAKTRGKFKKPNLTETVKFFFNEDLDGAHDAMVDTTACRRVYFAIKDMQMPKEIAPGLMVETVADILDKSDEDRAARMFAEALANNPDKEKPEYTAFEMLKINIDDLYEEAKNWLDGEPIKTQQEADAVATLIDRFQKAWKAADDQRDKEKRPHMEAANAVQARYKPLLDAANTAKDVAKSAQTVWLKKQRDALKELADAAAALALKQANEARIAISEANASADLDAREKAEDLVADAQALIADAKAIAKEKPQAKSADGSRALGLKSIWITSLEDGIQAMRHYWLIPERRAEIEDLMLDMARKDVRAGVRSIPGFKIEEDFIV